MNLPCSSCKRSAGLGRLPKLFLLVSAALLASTFAGLAQGAWTPVTRLSPGPVELMLLLSDGTVMAANQGAGIGKAWYKLTPDSHGSYTNGTWTTLASMHDTRLYYSSQVLRDGRVFVAGGEYGTGGDNAEVYNPLSNTWTALPSTGATYYDEVSEILPNGNVLMAPVFPTTSGGTLIFLAASNTFTNGPKLFRGSYQDEASWVKLPDDSILTIDPFGKNSERYIPSLNKWVNDAVVPVDMYDPFGGELGAAFLLPNGKAFYLGGTGHTAIYTPSGTTNAGTWAAGPDIPGGMATPDAPAAMMVNGHILCAVSAPIYQDENGDNVFPSPTSFVEYDPVANAFIPVNGPTGPTDDISSFQATMLDLPDGTVLYSHFGRQLYVYRPSGAPLAKGKPVINSVTQNPDGSYHLTGTGLNGISEGAAYGDDIQMNSNYPLVRMTDTNGNVFYARTFNWSSTSVMTSNTVLTTEFTLPTNLVATVYSLVAVGNGFSSDPVPFSTTLTITAQPQGLTVNPGTNVTFSVTASGVVPLTYQWSLNASNILGATNSSLTLSNVQVSDAGSYSVLVSNNFGTVTSSNAALVVIQAPTITGQPKSLMLLAGQSATFNVAAASTLPISYQWRFNGADISGATNSAFSLPSIKDSDAGSYSVVLTNDLGGAVSSNALLTVLQIGLYGDNALGQTTPPPSPTNIISVAAGDWHSLGLRANGRVLAWGGDFVGQCDVPPNLSNAVAIAAGGYHSAAIHDSGEVVVWGANDYGQTNIPPHLGFIIGIGAGTWHNLVLRRDGTIAAWGDNEWGQTNLPPGLSNVIMVAAGGNHNLALKADGTVAAWGENTDAEGATAGQSVVPPFLSNVVAIAAGGYHSLALKSDGTIVAWGDDAQGQTDVPPGLTNVAAIAAGGAHSVALLKDGSAIAWGDNSYGQCNLPPSVSNAAGISAGAYHTLLLSSGTMPVPRLFAPGVAGHQFSALLQSSSRNHYVLSFKNALDDGAWTPLPAVPGNGALLLLSDPATNATQRFYRSQQY